jgi:drug/metabolite transporter (DMT)-like permease
VIDASKARGLVYVFLAVVLWSTAEVVVRVILGKITPIQLSLARFVLAGAFLMAFTPMELRKRGLRVNRRILLHALWIGFIGVFISALFFQTSLVYTGAASVSIVWGTNPLMVMALSAVLLAEKLTPARLTGVLIGFAGILVVSMGEASESFSVFGVLLAVGAVFTFAIYTVAIKRFAGPYGGVPIAAFCCVVGSAFLLPTTLIEGEFALLQQHWPVLLLPVLYLGVGVTGTCNMLYLSGLRRIDAGQAASFLMLKPPMGALLAAVFLREAITWTLLAGMALILLGLYLVVRDIRRSERAIEEA